MKFKFKPSIGNISALAAILLAILGLIFGAVSASRGGAENAAYGVDRMGMLIAFSIVAMIAAAASFVFDCMFGGKLFSTAADVLIAVAAGFLIGAFAVMVNSRGLLMGDVWFSDQATGNPGAVSAMNMAVVSWVFYILGIVACGVAAFGGFCKKEKSTSTKSALSQEGIEN